MNESTSPSSASPSNGSLPNGSLPDGSTSQDNPSPRRKKAAWNPSMVSGSRWIGLAPATAPAAASPQVPASQVPASREKLSLEAARAQLRGKRGPEYWRSLGELADTPEFQELIEREFPRQAPRDWQPLSRRDFMKYMGAALALAGLSGCAYQPQEKIVPYVRMPEDILPGNALYFATATTLNGYALGLLAESNMGRPTKLEGNPDHPASLGSTDTLAQGTLYTLYDPDRSQSVRKLSDTSSWEVFVEEIRGRVRESRANGGAGLRILTETVTSPTLAAQLRDLQRLYPKMRWHQYEAAGQHAARAGARLAFGTDVHTIHHFDRADVVLALDSDFFTEEPGRVRYARDYTSRRRARPDGTVGNGRPLNRLYAIESTPTLVGAMADHRLPVSPAAVEQIARFLAGEPGATAPAGVDVKWLNALRDDLNRARGRSIVIAGPNQPAVVHALVHRINAQLGNAGTTIEYTEPVEAAPEDQFASLRELTDDMNAGRVDALLILGGNPAYDAPADIPFADALTKLSKDKNSFTAHLSLYDDETSNLAQWHLNEAHYLEAWSDARAYDGTATIIQPLIQPIYNGKSAHEVLAALQGDFDPTGYDIVRGYWQTQGWGAGQNFEQKWRKALNDGVVPNTRARSRSVAVRGGALPASATAASSGAASNGALELVVRPDPMIYDGRFANNGWLQELPKPFSRLTWDNAVLLSPETARQQGVISGSMVNITLDGTSVDAPVFIVPGQPDGVATVHLGYGRRRGGQLAEGQGFDAYPFRTTAHPYFASGLQIKKLGRDYVMATTENHHLINVDKKADGQEIVDDTFGRGMIRGGTLEQFEKNPRFVREMNFDGPQPPVAESLKNGLNKDAHSAEGGSAEGGTEHGAESEAGHGAEGPGAGGHGEKVDTNGVDKSYLGYDVHPSLFPWDQPQKELLPQPTATPKSEEQSQQPETAKREVLPEGYKTYGWGMTIDLNSCIGCSACTIACQSENNISTVGKGQVAMGREMHWIRIDTYFRGEVSNPQVNFQPMTCQHCEQAPCEPVCPVQATSHSVEGVNEMTYNRCVGTRYCSNNCPYKVRRFNFLQYSPQNTPSLMLMKNPDVTVRARGVMEKCTYCVQRINHARIVSQRERREIADGEIVVACQQACPTEAIQFGNAKDKGTLVARLKQHPLNYGVLTELNTYPRTTYLGRLRNPNPEIEKLESV